jgi:3-oxoacyl-[acyl-carrier protein] reductase
MRMKNRVALVTGGSRGIGASVARKLAAEGAKVAVVYKENRAAADEVAQGIRAKGGEADTFQGNVTDEHAVKAMVQEVVARFGKIDVLINAAGVFEAAALGEISRQLFQNEFLTHAWSVIAVTQAALPHFPKTGGHIVNVSTSWCTSLPTERPYTQRPKVQWKCSRAASLWSWVPAASA